MSRRAVAVVALLGLAWWLIRKDAGAGSYVETEGEPSECAAYVNLDGVLVIPICKPEEWQ